MAAPNLPCIANGHGNAAGLTPIASLHPPYFRRHTGRAVKTVWHGYVGRQLRGARSYKTWGNPHVTWLFGVLTRDERQWLGDHFGSEVTVRAFNEDTQTWHNYNATLLQPDLGATTRKQRKWLDVPYEFIDLVQI